MRASLYDDIRPHIVIQLYITGTLTAVESSSRSSGPQFAGLRPGAAAGRVTACDCEC